MNTGLRYRDLRNIGKSFQFMVSFSEIPSPQNSNTNHRGIYEKPTAHDNHRGHSAAHDYRSVS